MGKVDGFFSSWHTHRDKVTWGLAGVGGLCSLPMWYEILSEGKVTSTQSVVWGSVQLAAPALFPVAGDIARLAGVLLLGSDRVKRKRAREIMRELKAVSPPDMMIEDGERVHSRLSDVVHALHHLDDSEADSFWARAKETRNPYLGLKAGGRYCHNNQQDVGLDCMRESLDWAGGKQVAIPYEAYPMELVMRLAEALTVATSPMSVGSFLFLAGRYALIDPKKAWYYSELGRRLVDECEGTGLKNETLISRKEMYVFHALLASAQRRSDERSAWQDALRLLMAESQVESASERESRSEVFRFDGDFFANTLVVKKRPDLASLVREYDWQQKGKAAVSLCDVPEAVYVSREEDGLSCFAMRYRKGTVLYDLLEKGDKSSVGRVAEASGEIHARVPHDGLKQVEIWKKAKDKLYDPLLGVPRDLANTILAHYGPVEKGCWLAPAVINKDAHPEQWILGERLTAIDWEIDSLVPLTFDSANFTAYRDFFSPMEQREFVGNHVSSYKKHGGDMRGEDMLTSFYNAVIHRMICFTGAWSAPTRKRMRQYRKEAVARAIGAIDALQSAAPEFYREYADDYQMLRKSFVKLADLVAP